MGGGDIDGVDAGRQQHLQAEKSAELLAKLGRMFPDLPPMTAERSWAGAFADTDDGLPYIGCADFVERCHFALGYGGNGMVMSIVAAQIIRDAVLARSNSAAPLFSFERGHPSAAGTAG